jgi:hypothetical protein
MNPAKTVKTVRIARWIARVWSLVLFTFALIRVFTPDPNATEPVPALDWFLLSLLGLSILALMVAWRWELLGAAGAIALTIIRELAFLLLMRGRWFPGLLILWVAILPPAILYLVAWRLEKRTREEPAPSYDAR